jgi:hypothetical protein
MPSSSRFAALLFASTITVIAAPSQAQPAAPDVVLLKNGGVLRGTIAELVPNGAVTIVTAAGEKRVVNMADVRYAGPAANMPGAAPPPPTGGGPKPLVQVNAADAPLKLSSTQPEITFHVRVSEAMGTTVGVGAGMGTRGGGMGFGGVSQYSGRSYARICTAPCNATMPAGQYNLALSRGDGPPVETGSLTGFQGAATLQGRYTSYAALRATGFVITIVGLVGGIYLFATSIHSCDGSPDPNCEQIDKTRAFTGVGVLLGGAIIGGIMSSKSDDADISVVPAVTTGFRIPRAGSVAELPNGGTQPGLTVQARF